ncbi:hypothetical protein H045_02010 [Pseudomonas poae RE*1-1-14]|nr:YqcI/YcgG family protein [Pseudomonas poae]AGE24478.1 hypothetical protein H045_02010 [Pseudomonas poae RE*1-1-14]
MDNSIVRPAFKNLICQKRIREEGKDWHRAVLNDLELRLDRDSGFPCVFSKNAFRKQLLKFILVENIERGGIQHLAEGLKEYVDISNHWDGTLDTAYPLLVAFSLDAISAETVESYHAFGWEVLQKLHEIDSAPWPEDIAKDPESQHWSMCFNGMPLFINMSNPAHQVRRSRNLGEYFILVINPRERFDIFAGDNVGGRKVRSNIRSRIERYDESPHASQLGSYGAGGIEWWQYGLVEKNVERTDKCPFMFLKSRS